MTDRSLQPPVPLLSELLDADAGVATSRRAFLGRASTLGFVIRSEEHTSELQSQ